LSHVEQLDLTSLTPATTSFVQNIQLSGNVKDESIRLLSAPPTTTAVMKGGKQARTNPKRDRKKFIQVKA
jgi:hypothetical protein